MFKDFIKWCNNVGLKTNTYKALKEFVEGVKDGTLVKCSVCGEYTHEEHIERARFDYNEVVCPDCKKDGN